MTDVRKFFLEQRIRIILSEYSEARSEMKVNIQHQITLLATAMSTVGIAVGFAFTLLNRETINSPEIYRAIKFLLFVIVPGISTFFSMLWLDQVYRQLRVASYIRNIEIYLRKIVHDRTKFRFYHLPDGYEAYLDSMAEDNSINVHRLYYYMCLGVFLVLPFASIVVGLLIAVNHIDILSISFLAISFLIFSAGIFVGRIYVVNILRLFRGTGRSSRSKRKKLSRSKMQNI